MSECGECGHANAGLYCQGCGKRKYHRRDESDSRPPDQAAAVPKQSNFDGDGEVDAKRAAILRLQGQVSHSDGDQPAPTWAEVRNVSLAFLDDTSPVTQLVVERANGVEWYSQGSRVLISAVEHDMEGGSDLLVSVRTDIADLADVNVGLRLAAHMNKELPMSMFVLEDLRLSLRCVVRLTSTGRTLLSALRAAVLLQADYAHAARAMVMERGERLGARLVLDGVPQDPDPSQAFPAALHALSPDSGSWFRGRWAQTRPYLERTMNGLGWPTGWGNHEVQHFNEMPPDIAVALLDPPDSRYASHGDGITIIARVIPPDESVDTIEPDALNEWNLRMLSLGVSALGPLRADRGSIAGLRVDTWVPVAPLLDKRYSDSILGIFLANLACHVARSPFALLAGQ